MKDKENKISVLKRMYNLYRWLYLHNMKFIHAYYIGVLFLYLDVRFCLRSVLLSGLILDIQLE